VVVAILVALAAVAWVITARQAFDMGSMVSGLAEVGRRIPNDMAAPVFMAMWLAMMLPTVAPIVLAHQMVVAARGEHTPTTTPPLLIAVATAGAAPGSGEISEGAELTVESRTNVSEVVPPPSTNDP